MRDITGNLWTYNAQVTVITTNGAIKRNGAAVMGRGCALEAKTRYPGLDHELGYLLTLYGNRCFRIVPDRIRKLDRTLLTFPVKHRWNEAADLDLIAQSCEQAMQMANKFDWARIVLPRPGCGNGRLNYEQDVRPVISQILDARFHVITF